MAHMLHDSRSGMTRARIYLVALGVVLGASLPLAACSEDHPSNGSEPAAAEAGASEAAGADGAMRSPDDNGGFRVTVSGEDYVTTGFDFTPATAAAFGEPPAFVDGWAIQFQHVIVTVGNVRLSADPDLDPAAPVKVGAVVAEDVGAYAVDLVAGGDIVGKSGSPNERTTSITTFPNTASRFDPAKRYAFSYDTVAASADARLVNLDAEGKALYAEAITKGYAMLYVGTATYEGAPPAAGTVFAKMPPKVTFKLGFANPTSYLNCRNTDLAKVGGKYPRGVRSKEGEVVTAQITFHTDHTFWNRLGTDGTPLFFDAIAANSSTFGTSGDGVVSIDDLANVDITAVRTRTGEPLMQRSLVADYQATAEQMTFDPNGTSFARPNSFASYLACAAISAGHLNAFGTCEIKKRFTP